MTRLNALRAEYVKRPIPIEHLTDAYLRAVIERAVQGDEGWDNCTRMMAGAAGNP